MKIYKVIFVVFLLSLLLSSCAAPPTEEAGYTYFVKYESRTESWSVLEYEYCRTDNSGTNLTVYCWNGSGSHYATSADYSAEILEFKREEQ